MSQHLQWVTAEELARMPDDQHRHELVRGRLIEMNPPGFQHGAIAVSLASLLASHVRSSDLGRVVGEAGFKLAGDPDTVRGPDVAFVRRERLESSLGPEGFFHGAPDLAVEIASPGETASELRQKIREYLQAGARLVWVLQPDTRSVIVHRPGASPAPLGPDDVLDGEDVVSGFRCRVGDLFQ